MLLEAAHIAKSYGEYIVLSDASLAVSAGQVSVLMGANGSGKTTLFNIISGYLRPDKGKIKLNDQDICSMKPFQRKRKGIGRTFQDLRLIGDLTVLENVMLAFPGQEGEKWWKALLPNKSVVIEQRSNADKAVEVLRKCFIEDIASNKANEISFGQQKLLNLACCLASEASVLLLDEPVAGVNPDYRLKLTTIIKGLKEQGKSVLIIEHNPDFIKEVANEILFLRKGRIQRFESYQEFRDTPEIIDAYV